MENGVTSCILFILLVVSTQGRIPFLEPNQIEKHITEPLKTEIKSRIHAFNATVRNIEDVIRATLKNTSSTRKSCDHHGIDVNDNEIQPDDNEPCDPVEKDDNITALILTPYIEEGRPLEGRKASVVNPDLFLGFKSYSGFFTVNKTYDSNMFFWYFPVENKPVNETPWIIWLQGGPGASSMSGLFDEIGPFSLNCSDISCGTDLVRNPHTWLQNNSLVFIDNPVGTGFSFTNHENGYAKDRATYAKHLYSTLRQLLQLFPELRSAPLFLAGESYAGKYIPALGMEIYLHKNEPGGDINFKGIIMGNAYVETGMAAPIADTFKQFGLLSAEQQELIQPLLSAFQEDIAANRSIEAKKKWSLVVLSLLSLTQQKQAYNFLTDELLIGRFPRFLKTSSAIKRALHVGNLKYNFINITVNNELAGDFLVSARPLVETLLNQNYEVLVYCGQLDLMMGCNVAADHHRRWQWDKAELFRNATRKPFIYQNKLAGYHKTGGGLTQVLIRGAGHMAPADAPGAMHQLVSRWTHSLPVGVSPNYSLARIRFITRNYTDVYL